MGIVDVYGDRKTEQVMRETWGHLAPEKDKTYTGRIVFAVGCFATDRLNPTTLFFKFEELESSPWFYEAMEEWLQSGTFDEGCVYEFKGTFKDYKFEGKIRRILKSAI